MRSLLLVSLLCLSANLLSQTVIDSGDVSGVWTQENSPYNIHGDIYVQANQLLTIEPGVKVVFHGHYRLFLHNANLFALGSPEDSIVFTVADTSGFANGEWDEGGWYGINFSYPSNTGDSSHFGYCRFEYAKIPGDKYRSDMGVIGVNLLPRLTIRDCIFEHNKTQHEGLIDIHLSDLIIRNNIFRYNECAELISMQEDSPHIYGNRIDGNKCEVLLWITAWNHPSIHHNMIINNSGQIIRSEGNCRPRIYQNWILNNQGTIINFEKSRTEFINNLVANNDGTAFWLYKDESVIVQNTIVNNSSHPESVIVLRETSNLILGITQI